MAHLRAGGHAEAARADPPVFFALRKLAVGSGEAPSPPVLACMLDVKRFYLEHPDALPLLKVDEPTLTMNFLVNASPLAGSDGKYVTSRQIRERLGEVNQCGTWIQQMLCIDKEQLVVFESVKSNFLIIERSCSAQAIAEVAAKCLPA